MTNRLTTVMVALAIGTSTGWLPMPARGADTGDVRSRAERSFDQLHDQANPKAPTKSTAEPSLKVETDHGGYSSERYWIGRGQGDLTKGKAVCQRVSELSARTDLAKQIRVMVKEHMIDRVRDRTGRDPEQDIELTREELVQEYLQGVKIVDRRIDEENKICTAIAVMLKTSLQPKQATDADTAPPMDR